jgi:hypothetical protein
MQRAHVRVTLVASAVERNERIPASQAQDVAEIVRFSIVENEFRAGEIALEKKPRYATFQSGRLMVCGREHAS